MYLLSALVERHERGVFLSNGFLRQQTYDLVVDVYGVERRSLAVLALIGA